MHLVALVKWGIIYTWVNLTKLSLNFSSDFCFSSQPVSESLPMSAPIYRKYLVIILFVSHVFIPKAVSADHCVVSKIAIILGSWENTETKTSYTVQSQNASGESCHVSETLRLSFESTGGGSFTSQTGNPVQAWISNNSANRNFYYENNVAGDYVININAGYGTADNWVTLFSTTHDTASIPTITSNDEDDKEIDSKATTTTSNTNQNNTSNIASSHYSATPVTYLKPVINIEVGAGRDRISTVDTPLEFRADINMYYLKNTSFKWSFGDGNVANGALVTHAYKYPGTYVVVLNISSPDGKAVARSKVKIVEADLVLSHVSKDRIEVTNNSNVEINMYGRALVSGGKVFSFPQDTIIMSGQKINFDNIITGLNPNNSTAVYLMAIGDNPNLVTNGVVKSEEKRLEYISMVQDKITELQQKLATAHQVNTTQSIIEKTQTSISKDNPKETILNKDSQDILMANVLSGIESDNVQGLFQKLKRFFLRTH